MKYMRNELGILKITNIDKYTVSYENGQYAGTMDIEILSKYKQADTIEELCDEFVIRYDDRTCDTLNHDYTQSIRGATLEQYNMELKYGNCDLFGAIWTEWGLKYIAKMNEEGELCLL